MEGLRGYEMYRDERMTELKSWRAKFNSLVQRQRNVSPGLTVNVGCLLNRLALQLIDGHIDYTGKLKEVEGLMKKNARIADAIFDHGLQFYGITREELNDFARETNATANHRSGVMYAMKHIVRDWTPEGNHERDPTFPCILDALQQEFPAESRAQTSPRIVVPGAALGRLGHEIAALGDMNVVTNEFSATMNLAWRYLRSFPADTTSTIYPNVDWWSHRATTASMTRGIDFPDNVELLHQPSVELAEGDFVFDLKHYDGAVDAVVTHFFIDTAKNIVSYLEAIHALLKPGGIWINFGPLLYGSNPSIQLSLDEVIAMAEAIGMEIEEPQNPECGVPTWSDGRLRSKTVPYNADSESLSRNAYLAQFWVARKKA